MVKKVSVCLACAVVILSAARCFAQEMTLELVKKKVNDAVKMLAVDGQKGFDKIRDPQGEFRFGNGEGYIWIHDFSGMMVVHPAQPHLENTPCINLQDSRGFKFIAAMNKLVTDAGEGWVVYLWPKPGRHDEAYKAAFVKKAMIDGVPHVVGCGIYDAGVSDIKMKFPDDHIVKY